MCAHTHVCVCVCVFVCVLFGTASGLRPMKEATAANLQFASTSKQPPKRTSLNAETGERSDFDCRLQEIPRTETPESPHSIYLPDYFFTADTTAPSKGCVGVSHS